MHDGTCPCGTCHCEPYADAIEVADCGYVPVILNLPTHLSLNVYEPTPLEAQMEFGHEDPQERATAIINLALNAHQNVMSAGL